VFDKSVIYVSVLGIADIFQPGLRKRRLPLLILLLFVVLIIASEVIL
jgi:hypothetical protein